jgi:S-DNA-T family DNA segregation ATPase FtsK/SpoIIIE
MTITGGQHQAGGGGGELELAGPVFDAELVDEDQGRQPPSGGVARVVYPVVVVVRQVRQSEPTMRVLKGGVRQLVYLLAGLRIGVRRLWEARTNARPERLMRKAEALGDWDRLGEWHDRGEKARKARSDRRIQFLQVIPKAWLAVGLTIVGVHVLLLVIGFILAINAGDLSTMLGPLLGLYAGIAWVANAVAVAWAILKVVVPTVVVCGCWLVGRQSGNVPNALRVEHDSGQAVAIDELAINMALANLGLSALTQALKRGHPLIYTEVPARDGERGVSFAVRLPAGVAAREVVDRKPRLAANFGRAVVETWPSVGDDEQILKAWIAHRGALDTGAGAWPLLEATDPIDCFRGVPVGVILRGDQAVPPLDGTSWLIGGRPGQGKTNFTRLLVMGACLDPRARIWVHVLADNADYDPLAEHFERYAVGMGNDVAEQAMQAFNDLLAEIERRGRVMREQGVASAAEAGFPPIVAAFDEVHRLFQHREYGGDAAFVAEDLVKQARKYGIILILTTQSPTSTSIPRAISREVICRVAHSVIDQVGNDALLGDGSYRNGVRATELRPGSKHSPGDRGKALTVGVVPDSDWELLIAHHVDLAGVRHVATLARKFRAGYQTPAAVQPARDLLVDIAEMVGKRETPAGEVPALLKAAFPGHVRYQRLNRQDVLDALDAAGVYVPKTGNKWPVRPEEIAKARGVGPGELLQAPPSEDPVSDPDSPPWRPQ